jgi:hypothetical protein
MTSQRPTPGGIRRSRTRDANSHPTFAELDLAAREPERAAATLDHVDGCVNCQARLAYIYDDLESAPPSESSIERLLPAAPSLANGLAELPPSAWAAQ